MPLNSKALVNGPSSQANQITQYQVREVPLPNLQTWKHFISYRNESRQLIEAVSQGLKFHVPELMASGTGGAYLLRSEEGGLLAIFKPFDEDPFSLRNPKAPSPNPQGLASPFRPLMRPGEVAHREVAAYLLDRKNLAGVPLTTLVRVFGLSRWGKEGKIGSLQSYVGHDHDSWELSPSLYSKSDVHNIALFDLRLLNTDRHGGNILVRRTSSANASSSSSSGQGLTPETVLKLIPIDHGFCLPDSLEGDLWFEWMSWPQAKLAVDPRLKRYIQEIDLEEDCCLLRALGLGPETVGTMMFCSVLLQQALLKGLSPLQIAELLVRRDITNFVVENDNLVQVMRYHVEEMLNQIGGNSPPCRKMTLTLDPRNNTPKHRRQNSAPNLLDILVNASSSTY